MAGRMTIVDVASARSGAKPRVDELVIHTAEAARELGEQLPGDGGSTLEEVVEAAPVNGEGAHLGHGHDRCRPSPAVEQRHLPHDLATTEDSDWLAVHLHLDQPGSDHEALVRPTALTAQRLALGEVDGIGARREHPEDAGGAAAAQRARPERGALGGA